MPSRRYPHFAVTVHGYTADTITMLKHIVNKQVRNGPTLNAPASSS